MPKRTHYSDAYWRTATELVVGVNPGHRLETLSYDALTGESQQVLYSKTDVFPLKNYLDVFASNGFRLVLPETPVAPLEGLENGLTLELAPCEFSTVPLDGPGAAGQSLMFDSLPGGVAFNNEDNSITIAASGLVTGVDETLTVYNWMGEVSTFRLVLVVAPDNLRCTTCG